MSSPQVSNSFLNSLEYTNKIFVPKREDSFLKKVAKVALIIIAVFTLGLPLAPTLAIDLTKNIYTKLTTTKTPPPPTPKTPTKPETPPTISHDYTEKAKEFIIGAYNGTIEGVTQTKNVALKILDTFQSNFSMKNSYTKWGKNLGYFSTLMGVFYLGVATYNVGIKTSLRFYS